MEVPVPYAFTLTTTIPASPQEIYEAWLDSLAHSEMTGGDASMSDAASADVSAWDGYITGRNVELVPGERIVQSWRTTQFTDEHEDSLITVTLEEVEDGTLLTLLHTNVPDAQTSYEHGGWQEHYFDPMKEYFANRKGTGAGLRLKPAARKTKPKPARAAPRAKSKRAATHARSKHAATRGKSKRVATRAKSKRVATGAKSKRAAPRAKVAVGKKTPRRATAAKSRRPRAKKTKSKPARGQRR
jgi:uncharacterized protein YndB with AHSA1/START domain